MKNKSFTLLLTSGGQQWKFHFATDILIKYDNFELLLKSSGQVWQFWITMTSSGQE